MFFIRFLTRGNQCWTCRNELMKDYGSDQQSRFFLPYNLYMFNLNWSFCFYYSRTVILCQYVPRHFDPMLLFFCVFFLFSLKVVFLILLKLWNMKCQVVVFKSNNFLLSLILKYSLTFLWIEEDYSEDLRKTINLLRNNFQYYIGINTHPFRTACSVCALTALWFTVVKKLE